MNTKNEFFVSVAGKIIWTMGILQEVKMAYLKNVENVIVEGTKLYHRCIGCKGQEGIVKKNENER